MEKLLSNEDQRKWDILYTFCYSYICSPPIECLEDVEMMSERDKLFELVDNCVHSTNWKSILSANSQMRLITLSIRHAKDFYNSEVIGQETEPYRAIKSYFKRVDWERQILRDENPPPLSHLRLYMKMGDKYASPKAINTNKKTSKKK
jgi:hypothetical protein